jgi:hypothetical protein
MLERIPWRDRCQLAASLRPMSTSPAMKTKVKAELDFLITATQNVN